MANYDKQIKLASRLIQAKGLEVTFAQVTESNEYDSSLDCYKTVVKKSNVYGVRSTANIREVQGYGFSMGSEILYIAGDKIENIDTTDYIIMLGHKYDILNVQKTAPAEQNVLYCLELRDAGVYNADDDLLDACMVNSKR